MAHIFKPGDKAYWIGVGWRELIENHEGDSSLYPLRSKDSLVTFTADGRRYARGGDVVLLPINPYDPNDPKNPPESRYPFMLNGRPVKIGDTLYLPDIRKSGRVLSLAIDGVRKFCTVRNSQPLELSDENFSWPDEVPSKKKVAKWAYPTIGVSGRLTVYFTEEITEEEARKVCGSSVEMIPGTEREVEG